MSLINQVLTDLEERRASGRERSGIPDHVRALPAPRSTVPVRPLAGMATLVAVAAAGVWYASTGNTPVKAPQPVAAMPAPAASPSVPVPAPAASTESTATENAAWSGIASRMTLELMAVPEAPVAAQARTREPVPSGKVVAKSAAPADARSSTEAASKESRKAALASEPARAESPSDIEKQVRQPTAQQIAENHYARASSFMHLGRLAEARDGYEAAVRAYPGHAAARQAWAGLLINARQFGDAEKILQEGLRLDPRQTGFAMTVARIQVDTGSADNAIETLQRSAAYAQDNADYLGLLAALLQRRQRHAEAIEQFQAALRLKPQNGLWIVATGVSLQALGRSAEARDYFRRAQAVGGLNADVQAYVEQRLRQAP